METTAGLFGALEVAQRQYDLACEVKDYLKEHPTAAVVNLYEIMQFASCHLREVVYNNSLIKLTTLRVSSRCPVMIEDRKRWGFERLSIRTGHSRNRKRPLPSVGGRVWGVSIRWVNQYVRDGRVPGAERLGRAWAIPETFFLPSG